MSPKTTPSAPAASRSALPPWCGALGRATRGCGACGSSADSAWVPGGATWAIREVIPGAPAERNAPLARTAGGRSARARRGGRNGRALLAGLEQAVAQLGLLLRARVPLRGIGQAFERIEAEQLEEQRRRPVEHRAELRPAGLLDEAALQQRRGGGVGADATDARDLGARHRLEVGDDRERLALRGRQGLRPWPGEQAPCGGLGLGRR